MLYSSEILTCLESLNITHFDTHCDRVFSPRETGVDHGRCIDYFRPTSPARAIRPPRQKEKSPEAAARISGATRQKEKSPRGGCADTRGRRWTRAAWTRAPPPPPPRSPSPPPRAAASTPRSSPATSPRPPSSSRAASARASGDLYFLLKAALEPRAPLPEPPRGASSLGTPSPAR
jgi:hypothetical protein